MYLESTASVQSFAPTCALKCPPINMCVFDFLHLSVCVWSSEYILLHVLVSVSPTRQVD